MSKRSVGISYAPCVSTFIINEARQEAWSATALLLIISLYGTCRDVCRAPAETATEPSRRKKQNVAGLDKWEDYFLEKIKILYTQVYEKVHCSIKERLMHSYVSQLFTRIKELL